MKKVILGLALFGIMAHAGVMGIQSLEDDTILRNALTGSNEKPKKPAYDMPGGKGSLDKIIGRDPKTGKVEPYYRDVTKEEADKIRAKNRYDDANKELEKAKIAYNKKPTNENKSKVEEASHKAELAKAHLQEANEKKGK